MGTVTNLPNTKTSPMQVKSAVSLQPTHLEKSKQTAVVQQLTQQLTPVNPLSRTPSRSRSNSPMTFTSCVKVQYKPKTVPNQPLYGFNQFQDRTCFQKNSSLNDLSRSRSATAIISTTNS